jgi:hypothetical protein
VKAIQTELFMLSLVAILATFLALVRANPFFVCLFAAVGGGTLVLALWQGAGMISHADLEFETGTPPQGA